MGRTLLFVAIVGAALAGLSGLTARADAAIVQRDLSYDIDSPPSDPNLNALDLYVPDGAQPSDSRPVVVYVHGGAWRTGDKASQIADKVTLFTGAGYVFASVNYRLSPRDPTVLDPARIKFPDQPDDVGEAIGWLDRNVEAYGGDPGRMLLIGHSAGAHLVSLVSTDPSYVGSFGVEPWQLIGTVSLDTDAFDIASEACTGERRCEQPDAVSECLRYPGRKRRLRVVASRLSDRLGRPGRSGVPARHQPDSKTGGRQPRDGDGPRPEPGGRCLRAL